MAHPRFLWEVAITAANDNLVFDEGAGPLTAVLVQGSYYLRGGGAAATDLIQEIDARMTAAGGQAYNVVRSATGRVTISAPGAFTLRWATGGAETALVGAILGFDVAANDTGTNSYTSDFQHRHGWYPEQHLIDGRRRLESATGGAVRALGNQQWTQQWATDFRAEARIDFVRRAKVRGGDVEGTSVGGTNEAFTALPSTAYEGLYQVARRGVRFEFHPDEAVVAALTAVVDPEASAWIEDLDEAAEVIMEAGERYRVTVPMRPYTA